MLNDSAQVDAEVDSAAVSALAVSGPVTAAGAALGRRLVAALVAATRASPGESGEGLLSAAGHFEAGGWPEVGESRDWHTGPESGLVR
jgi:hypothetical protein